MIPKILFAILITAAAFACVLLLFVGLVGKVYDHEDHRINDDDYE